MSQSTSWSSAENAKPLCHVLTLKVYCAHTENQQTQNFCRIIAMNATIQVRQRGILTLPAELRDRYNIEPGDTYRVLDLDGIFVLTPMIPMVPELAQQIEQARCDAGLSIDDLMTALREQRMRYAAENVIGSEDE
jgi:bifunctional DNA-binding transcriptional regulator/antitoxin component of YhaV-PrlF toxin-antitoxin module